jgi:hypothetical protein
MYHGKVEVGIKIGEAIYCAALSLTSYTSYIDQLYSAKHKINLSNLKTVKKQHLLHSKHDKQSTDRSRRLQLPDMAASSGLPDGACIVYHRTVSCVQSRTLFLLDRSLPLLMSESSMLII